MSASSPGRGTRLLKVLAVNLLLFLLLFGLLEFSARVYHEGLSGAVSSLLGSRVPYSNLGTSNWVIYDEELGYRLNPKINERSIRHGPVSADKADGVFRIIHLGDSIPWDRPGFVGHSTAQLEELGNFEVINASVPGYTAYQEVLFYQRFLADLEPDLVIWTYCLNDNHRFLHRFNPKGRMLLTEEARRSFEVDSAWDWIVSRSHVLAFLKSALLARRAENQRKQFTYYWERSPDFNVAWKDSSWDLYEEQLKNLKRQLDATDSRLAILIAPYGPQLDYGDFEDLHDEVLKPQRTLLALCGKYQIPCLDLYPAVLEGRRGGQQMLRDGVHFTDAGHRVVTEELMRFLAEQKLLPPAGGAESEESVD